MTTTSADERAFAYTHAFRWADRSAYWVAADDYADWFLEQYWTDHPGLAGLPSHPDVFGLWIEARGTRLLGEAMEANR